LERGKTGPLYLAHDTHWTPLGAEIAAQAVASKLGEMSLTPATRKEFRTQAVAVTRWGDILDMMQIPGLRGTFASETALCMQVLDRGLVLVEYDRCIHSLVERDVRCGREQTDILPPGTATAGIERSTHNLAAAREMLCSSAR